ASDLEAGVYVFRLTATDNDGATAFDEVRLTVQSEFVNQSPAANAGPDVVVSLPQTNATLNGSGSDPDGTVEGYSWEKISGPAVTLGATDESSLQLSNLVEGVYVFELTVIDNLDATGTDLVQVTVSGINQDPVADAGADIVVTLPDNS